MNKDRITKQLILLIYMLMFAFLLPNKLFANTHEIIAVTFEEAEEGFVPRGQDEIVVRTDEDAKEGSYSLSTTDRTEAWNGPSIRIEDQIELSTEYIFSVWVKLSDDRAADLQLSTQIGDGNNASYQIIATETVDSDEWVQLEGVYRYDSIVDDFISVYIESTSEETVSFLIDEFSITATNSGSTNGIQTNLESIKDVYEDYFLIGNAISMTELEGQRLELLKHHHNLVTAENAMKPEYAYNTHREFNFEDQLQLVDRIQEEGLLLHGHVLVWHQQSPEWLHTENGELLSREEALVNMERHIEETILQYGDSVIAWEVVNEAMNDNPRDPEMWRVMLRRSAWFDAIGDDYLELAYLKAREVLDENGWHDVKLYYNDYNDDNQNKATAIYHMVKEINEQYAEDNPGELLIDGIGMQGHYNMGTSVDNVRQSLERFKELGVEIGVTELDITANTTSELSEEDEIAQGILYAQLFSLYKEHSDVISRVTLWGLDDSTSWRAERSPLLFNRDLQAKKAYEAVIDPEGFLAEYASEGEESEKRNASISYGTPELTEDSDEVWEESERIELDRYQLAWQGATGVGRVLWDEDHLYVKVEVEDSAIDTSSELEWEQDSIEVFLKESASESSAYQEEDGHYRVNAVGDESVGDTTNNEIESYVSLTNEGYTVQLAIPWQTITPEEGKRIGFDLQINDAASGSRESIAIWNDLSGQGYQNTSVFGELVFEKNEEFSLLNNDENDLSNTILLIVIITLSAAAIAGSIVYMKQRKNK